jgi:hypothetical protein
MHSVTMITTLAARTAWPSCRASSRFDCEAGKIFLGEHELAKGTTRYAIERMLPPGFVAARP